MGQAKQRGTYEQRRAVGVERRKRELREKHHAEMARRAAMTPAEKAAEMKARMLLGVAVTLMQTNTPGAGNTNVGGGGFISPLDCFYESEKD